MHLFWGITGVVLRLFFFSFRKRNCWRYCPATEYSGVWSKPTWGQGCCCSWHWTPRLGFRPVGWNPPVGIKNYEGNYIQSVRLLSFLYVFQSPHRNCVCSYFTSAKAHHCGGLPKNGCYCCCDWWWCQWFTCFKEGWHRYVKLCYKSRKSTIKYCRFNKELVVQVLSIHFFELEQLHNCFHRFRKKIYVVLGSFMRR